MKKRFLEKKKYNLLQKNKILAYAPENEGGLVSGFESKKGMK